MPLNTAFSEIWNFAYSFVLLITCFGTFILLTSKASSSLELPLSSSGFSTSSWLILLLKKSLSCSFTSDS